MSPGIIPLFLFYLFLLFYYSRQKGKYREQLENAVEPEEKEAFRKMVSKTNVKIIFSTIFVAIFFIFLMIAVSS